MDLTFEQFTMMKNFILNPFLGIFPTDIRPNIYTIFSEGATVYYPRNLSDIVQFIENRAAQDPDTSESYFISPISLLLYYNVLNYSSTAGVPQNVVIFTGGPLHDKYFDEAVNDTKLLTANGNTLTVVFVKPNMNLTNYQTSKAYFPKSRPENTSDIVEFVKRYPQLTGKSGNLDVILKQLLARNVTSNNDSLPVNTVIFTGSNLPSNGFETTLLLVKEFTTTDNTLTIVFTNPNINQQNYQAIAFVSHLILVQYNSNEMEMIADIRDAMICN
uniref:Uncharacterized protein n=1 Tax=Panagrolaimus sp. JU765 TaxID=591449 RepID=A0AC34RA43_9BILA